MTSLSLSAASAQAGVVRHSSGSRAARTAKAPKAKDYTYCATLISTGETECFPGPFEVFKKTHTWVWNEPEKVSGTYTVTGKHYDFRETSPETRDELIGTKRHGVISGRLYENGTPGESTFTLTPR